MLKWLVVISVLIKLLNVNMKLKASFKNCCSLRLQCHEASIAIYSSMENQKLSHWVFVAVVSMFFCLLIYTLTGEFTPQTETVVQYELTWELLIAPALSISRCVRFPDVWTSCCLRYFDVIFGRWCSHDHFQTAFWNIDYHHLSYHSSSGEVSDNRAVSSVSSWNTTWSSTTVIN